MRELWIAGHRIADDTDCYVVAEIGHNHQGDLDKAKALILAAHDCGANAVKFQKRDLATWQAADPDLWGAPYHSEHAFGATYGAHRAALEFDAEQYHQLQVYARELGITLFATAFDLPSLKLLSDLEMPAVKLGSGQATDERLIREVLRTTWRMPLILSTGGCTLEQVRWPYELATEQASSKASGNRAVGHALPLAILQATSVYPCEAEELNLRVIAQLREVCPAAAIGLSDHYPKPNLAVAAYALGARVIEKHFTLNRAWKGSDHAFSLEPDGLRTLVAHLREVRLALGDGIKRPLDAEIPALRKMGRRDLITSEEES